MEPQDALSRAKEWSDTAIAIAALIPVTLIAVAAAFKKALDVYKQLKAQLAAVIEGVEEGGHKETKRLIRAKAEAAGIEAALKNEVKTTVKLSREKLLEGGA